MRKSTELHTKLDIQGTCKNNNNNGTKISSLALLGAVGLVVVGGGAYALYSTGHVGGKRQLPPGPQPWAMFGTSMHLGTTPCQVVAKLCSCNYGGMMTVYMGNMPTIIITSSKIALQVLEKYNTAFCPPKKFTWPYTLLFPAGYQNLKCVPPYNGAHWHKLRQIYVKFLLEQAYAMSFQPAIDYDIKILQCNLSEEMAKGDSIKPAWITLRPHLRHAAFKLIFNICFGKRVDAIAKGIGSHKDPNVMQLEALFMELIRLGPAFIISDFLPAACHLPTPIDLQRAAISKKLEKIFLIVIQDYRERANTKAPKAPLADLVDHLVSLTGDERLHDKEIVWLLSELILANTDSVSASLEWIIAHLMSNPHMQLKVHQEIDNVCNKRSNISMPDLSKMTYLNAFIKESIRISSPVTFSVPHSSTKEVNIGGYRIPINTQIICHLGALGQDLEVHKHPECFDPSRFIDENPCHESQWKRQRDIVHLIAKKLCPGRGLEFLHVHIIIVKILQLFELSPLYADVKPFKTSDTIEWGVIHLLRKPLVACLKPHL